MDLLCADGQDGGKVFSPLRVLLTSERAEVELSLSIISNRLRPRRSQHDSVGVASGLELVLGAIARRIEWIELVGELHGVGVRRHVGRRWHLVRSFANLCGLVSGDESRKYDELLLNCFFIFIF